MFVMIFVAETVLAVGQHPCRFLHIAVEAVAVFQGPLRSRRLRFHGTSGQPERLGHRHCLLR